MGSALFRSAFLFYKIIVNCRQVWYNAVMESVRVKSYAKINLTLNITGVEGGYHMLDSVVTTVDLYDLIVVKKRKDSLVSITMRGCGSEGIAFEENNAARAAEAFIKAYQTRGADITVYKNIPIGAGLGGSSADAAGVLNALFSLYKIDDTAGKKLLADKFGSDTRYMLTGGYARLFGRGNIVQPIEGNLKLNLLLLTPKGGVSTAECYRRFDQTGTLGGNSDGAENAITSGDLHALSDSVTNALTPAACSLSADIQSAVDELKKFDPLAVNMTGSGSGVYAIFENAEFCRYAKSRYRGKHRAYELKTHLPKLW